MDTPIQGQQKSGDGLLLDFNQRSLADLPSSGRIFVDPGNLPRHDESEVEGDYFDGVFKYINQMLMEEDLEEESWMFHDCFALQAAENTFSQVLNEVNCSFPCASPASPSIGVRIFDDPKDDFNTLWKNDTLVPDVGNCQSLYSSVYQFSSTGLASDPMTTTDKTVVAKDSNSGEGKSRKSVRSREDENQDKEERHAKQLASSVSDENERTEDYDDALLCPQRDPNFYGESDSKDSSKSLEVNGESPQPWLNIKPNTSKRGRPRAADKKCNVRETVDLRDLLSRCAHAVATYNIATSRELLKKIKQHSSLYGDATERLADSFANALDARMAGIGPNMYAALTAKKASAAEILKAYLTYVTICPFQRMSNIFANKSIARFTTSAPRIHIIDFGVLYGFQWPCIIHGLSLRPGGPPRLRITGIDLPQPGFRPAEKVEETGRRLADYAKRFGLPFQYNAIAKRWDTITLEDLKIDKDEMLVVNCMYKLKNLNDETVGNNNPRLAVMKLIKDINPELYVHGILNAGYNAPFFETRFREAMYHFSSMFDMFEATLPREDQDRLMFEKEILGRDVMNVIACEGAERIDRPDTYKQWQVKNQRAGFKQLPLNKEIMREVTVKIKASYHRDFLIDENSSWMLMGWKGRVIYAISCWTP